MIKRWIASVSRDGNWWFDPREEEMPEPDSEMVLGKDYDALAAEYMGFRNSTSDTYKRLATERIALETALRDMVDRWEPDGDGSDKRMWLRAKALLTPVETACESPWVTTKKQAIEPTAEAADAFWKYWRENGETHTHGYYESTWGAINAALNATPSDRGTKP